MTNNELCHYGIKGQKWGIRRFQNQDGSYTRQGLIRRYGSDAEPRRRGLSDSTKKKLKTAATVGAALAVTAGVAMYVSKHPEVVQKASKYVYDHKDEAVSALTKTGTAAAKTTARGASAVGKYLYNHKDEIAGAVKTVGTKTGEALGKAGVKAGKALGKSLEKAGDAALNAAMTTVGTMAALKIAEKYAANETDSERVKFAKKVAVDSATAAIKAATSANFNSSNSGSNKGGNVGKEVTEAIGGPSNKGIDRSSARYQALFKDSSGNQRDADTRSTIKSMASAGYDIDQIERYLEIKHSYMRDGLYHSLIRYKRR